MPKTPITYYGGKLNLLKEILPRIPVHRIYTEAFFGGGAVFFAKEPAESEIINDRFNMAIVFYRMCVENFKAIKTKVEGTLFSRASYKVAVDIYKVPHLFNALQQAWAFYVGINMGFACNFGSWGFDRYGKRPKSFLNKKMRFDETVHERLKLAQIEDNDAIKVISTYDTEDTFHYIDPPYVGSDQGHYGGYSESDYINLLDCLSEVKGKFLLSSYPSELLDGYIQKKGWYSIRFEKPLSAQKAKAGKPRDRKIEVLTANYPI